MPVELVFLHVRPVDLISPATTAILAQVLHKRGAGPVALQVLLHRHLGGAWSETDRIAFAAFMGSLVVDCSDERAQQRMKIILVGEQGLLRAFTDAEADTPVAGAYLDWARFASKTDTVPYSGIAERFPLRAMPNAPATGYC